MAGVAPSCPPRGLLPSSRHRRSRVPTRRILELMIITGVLLHPVMGLARLWSMKTLATSQPGTLMHGVAEAILIPVGVS